MVKQRVRQNALPAFLLGALVVGPQVQIAAVFARIGLGVGSWNELSGDLWLVLLVGAILGVIASAVAAGTHMRPYPSALGTFLATLMLILLMAVSLRAPVSLRFVSVELLSAALTGYLTAVCASQWRSRFTVTPRRRTRRPERYQL
jgi:hypothetical protein